MPSRGIAIWRLGVRVEKRRIDGNVSKKKQDTDEWSTEP